MKNLIPYSITSDFKWTRLGYCKLSKHKKKGHIYGSKVFSIDVSAFFEVRSPILLKKIFISLLSL